MEYLSIALNIEEAKAWEYSQSGLYATASPLYEDETCALWGEHYARSEDFSISNIIEYCRTQDASYLTKGVADFVFIYVDKQAQKVMVLRDRMGTIPAYYWGKDKQFVVSTDIEVIRQLSCVSEAPNYTWMHDYIYNMIHDPTYTFYKEIYKLATGHLLEWSRVGMAVREYWIYQQPLQPLHYAKEEEYVAHFQDLLAQAVYSRLDGGQVGLELSSGLDSGAVFGVALPELEKQRRKIFCYSHTRAKDTKFTDFKDERARIEENLEAITATNYTHSFVDREGQGIRELYQKAFDLKRGVPVHHYAIYVQDIVAKAAADGVQTMLSGWGGDQGVSQRKLLVAHYFGKGKYWKGLQAYRHKPLRQRLGFLKQVLVERFINPYKGIRERMEKRTETMNSCLAYFPELQTVDLEERYQSFCRTTIKSRAIQEFVIHGMKLESLVGRIEATYHVGKAYGIRYEYPLLDSRLIEFILALPSEVFVHKKQDRYLFRKAIAKFLPEQIVRRDKPPMSMYGWLMDAYLYDYQHQIQYKELQTSFEGEFYRKVEDIRDKGTYRGNGFKNMIS